MSEDETWTIAFGSCNKPEKEQPLWPLIAAHQPNVWLWLGDIVYGDTQDPVKLAQCYEGQAVRKDFQAFQKRVPIQIGIYDDHDYGKNDGGKEFPIREKSQQILLDFLGEPPDSARRRQEGAYTSYLYGPPGKQVKVILLDTRYHRDPIKSNGTILGETQWKWLENELRNSTASIHIIASSIQVIASEHRFEKWSNFPKEHDRLLNLVAVSRVPGVIFLSGDRHRAELSCQTGTPVRYTIYDLTSSGLTHARAADSEEPNRFRVGKVYPELNYGLVLINWSAKTVQLSVHGMQSTPEIDRVIPFSEIAVPH